MGDTNFDPSESNWDDFPEENSWNEHQWRKYLKDSDSDIERFLSIYNTLKDKPNHFDEIATEMGWNIEDISLAENFDFTESEDGPEENFEEDDCMPPYTPLSHPVIVVTHALYSSLRQIWENYIDQNGSYASPQFCWQYADSLHQAEMNVVFAVHAIDLGDYGLTICHLKNSLSSLNKTFSLLNQIVHPNEVFLANFRQEIRVRLFDLRELWIRVMGDCRIECNRRCDNDSD
ncbi:MAG: hypothetical protein ACJAT5_000715 [Lentimonas sp.]|jgi:hypothetical protein